MRGSGFRLFIILAVVLTAASAFAAAKPSGLISDNAVLQQGIRVPIWGTADTGEKVTVKFQGQEVSTVAKDGWWLIHLSPLKAGGPYTMKINDLEFNNILVGEVWVCSGQSNMALQLKNAENGDKAIAEAKDPMLRLFLVPKMGQPQVLPRAWQESTPDSAPTFSAVGYFFGKSLRQALKVPVGLIDSSVGGTPAEAWTSRSCLMEHPGLAGPTRISYLYNSMIAPLEPYGIRGAIWYQGESNASRAYKYRDLMATMIQCWRDAWGEGDFPFLIVQLAPYARAQPANSWPEIREAQLLITKTVPNTAMAVITDVGDADNIHPKKKEPVGTRLALAARAITYGEDIEYSGPTLKSWSIEGGKVIMDFDHRGGKMPKEGPDVHGFTIAGSDGNFVPAMAKMRRYGVAVWSPDVPNPVAVRYGWADFPEGDLANADGLPASPFRTDNFPLTTGPK